MATHIDEKTRSYRRWLIEATNEAYAALREKPEDWKAIEDERAVLESTLADGLEKLDP